MNKIKVSLKLLFVCSLISALHAEVKTDPSEVVPDFLPKVIVKFRANLAQQVENILPVDSMELDKPQGHPNLVKFFKKYGAKKLYPLYKGLVHLKKQTGKSEQQLQQETRDRFPQRTKRGKPSEPLPELSRTYVFTLDPTTSPGQALLLIESLHQDPDVEFAELDSKVKAVLIPNDPYFSSNGTIVTGVDDLYGLKITACPTAWDISTGAGTVVAVIDTGIDYTHEDLASNVWINLAEVPNNFLDDDGNGFVDDVRGWDFSNNDNDPLDDNGHGSHVSGTVAAIGNNATGIIGVAFNSHVMAVKVLDNAGFGSYEQVAQGIIYAADKGADVINMSLSGHIFNQTLADAVNYARGLGVVVVAAAGNEIIDVKFAYPANLPGVIAVSASDWNDAKAYFSNWGHKIDVSAPGVEILSLRGAGTDLYGDGKHFVGTNYYRANGTSMSTPHVAGVASLIISLRPGLSNDQIQQVIRKSSDDRGNPGFDVNFGNGRLNATQAVDMTSSGIALIRSPLHGTFYGEGTNTIVTVQGDASAPGFANWYLEDGAGISTKMSGNALDTEPVSWALINQGGSPVSNGTLGTLDVTGHLENETHVLQLTVTDNLGNTFSDRIGVVVARRPTVVIAYPSYNYQWVSGIVTISGTAADDSGVQLVEVAPGSIYQPASGTENWTYTWDTRTIELANNIAILARATDIYGNFQWVYVVVNVDNRPLTISNVQAQPSAYSTNITWATDRDADSQVEYGLTTAYGQSTPLDTVLSTSHSVTISGLQEQTTYHYRVRSEDIAGNEAVSGDFIFTTLADQPPAVSINNPVNNAYVLGTVVVSGTANDDLGLNVVEVQVDQGPFNPASGLTNWSYSWNTTLVTDGNHTLTSRATDTKGKTKTAQIMVTVDNTQPTLTITSPANGAAVAGTFNVVGTAADNISLAKVEVKIDNAAFKPATGTTNWSYTIDTKALFLLNGNHTITAQAMDAVGNSHISQITVLVDNTPPAVVISNPKNNAYVKGILNISGAAADAITSVASVEVQIDSGPFEPATGTTSWSYSLDTTLLLQGAHTVLVRAKDAVGNFGYSQITINVDNTLPTIVITTPANNVYVKGTITVAGTAADNLGISLVQVKIDNGVFQSANGTANWSYSLDTKTYTDGSHNVTSQVTDLSGNTQTAQVTIIVDNTTPTTTDNAPIGWVTNDVTVTLTPLDTGSGVADTLYSTDSTNTSTPNTSGTSVVLTCTAGNASETYVRYQSVDKVGNIEAVKSKLVQIDKSAPQGGSITYPNGDTTSPIRISFVNGTDTGSGLGTRIIQRRQSTISGKGICGVLGPWTDRFVNPVSSPVSDTVTKGCYQYRYVVQDKVGYTTIYISDNTAKIRR